MLSPLVMLTLLDSLLPFPKKFPGASLRDRATLPSPLRGLGPSGGYPSRLRSLRSLRAPLAPAVRCAHRRLPSHRRRGFCRRCGRSAAAASPRWRCAPGALRRGGPTAHAPRRLPSGSGSWTGFPCVLYPGLGPSYALRRPGSHTPRSGLPGASPAVWRCTRATLRPPQTDRNRHQALGSSVYRSDIRY